mgnify:CR=1 FL=1
MAKTIRKKSTKSKNKLAKRKATIKNNKLLKKPSNEIVLGLLYADWCPHCINMKSEWESMKTMLPENVEVIQIEERNPDKTNIISRIEKKLNGNHIENKGYPTIFKVNENRVEYYGGERSAQLMGGWAITNMNGGFQARKHGSPYKYNRSKSKSKSKSKRKD